MARVIDGTKIAPHGMFFMENARDRDPEWTDLEEHAPSCFALEEEKGESWHGGGAASVVFKDVRPSL